MKMGVIASAFKTEGRQSKITAKKGITVVWFEIDGALNEVGKHQISITIGSQTTSIDVEIINAELDFKDFIYTCWFHTDCLASYYKFDVFSEFSKLWKITGRIFERFCEYGRKTAKDGKKAGDILTNAESYGNL